MQCYTYPLVVLFGLPGAGKSYLAHRLGEETGYLYCEGDEAMAPQEKDALRRDGYLAVDIRERAVARMISGVRCLRELGRPVVFCQALIHENDRVRFRQTFPEAMFVWVDAPRSLRKARVTERQGHIVDAPRAESIEARFDVPRLPHVRLDTGDAWPLVWRRLRTLLDLR